VCEDRVTMVCSHQSFFFSSNNSHKHFADCTCIWNIVISIARYAQRLVDALEQVGANYTFRTPPSGHEQSDPIMAKCLHQSLQEFFTLSSGHL
jgi:hypothetical protein